MEWKNRTLRSMLKGNKEKVLFLFCSGLLLFVISLPDSGKTDPGWNNRAAEVLADVGDESAGGSPAPVRRRQQRRRVFPTRRSWSGGSGNF